MSRSAFTDPLGEQQIVQAVSLLSDLSMHGERKRSPSDARLREFFAIPEHCLQVHVVFCQLFKKLLASAFPKCKAYARKLILPPNLSLGFQVECRRSCLSTAALALAMRARRCRKLQSCTDSWLDTKPLFHVLEEVIDRRDRQSVPGV